MSRDGKKTGGGSRKGCPNKSTKALKDMILQALNDAEEGGGVAYLKARAKDSPAAFLALIGKVLPLQVTGEGGGPAIPQINVVISHKP